MRHYSSIKIMCGPKEVSPCGSRKSKQVHLIFRLTTHRNVKAKFTGCFRVSFEVFLLIFVHFNYGCLHPCVWCLNIVFSVYMLELCNTLCDSTVLLATLSALLM